MNRFLTYLMLACALSCTPLTLAAKTTASSCSCSAQRIAVGKKAIPAVVFIKVQGNAETDDETAQFQNPFLFDDDFFNRFFGVQPKRAPKQPQYSQGSGFLVSSDGYIMTNAHVVKGADKMTVIMEDGRSMDAILVGLDTHTDVAIIKIEGKNFPYLQLGDSEEMEIGEDVIAIGSPFQLEASLTTGVISAKGRQDLRITDLEDFIQTDAAINMGNSGGPLLNLKGEVIGINTAILSRTGGYMGIGFAIPSNMAKHIMGQIIDNGSVTRGYLGVSLQPVDQDIADAFELKQPEGVLVSEVVKDSPAEKAGLKQGDVILSYDGNSIKSMGSFRNGVSLLKPGTKLNLKVKRRGKILTIPVTLGSHAESGNSSGNTQKVGIEVSALTPELAQQLGLSHGEEGLVVTRVRPGSPAAMAGIRPGFLILAIDHKKVSSVEDFNEALQKAVAKNRVLFLIKQGNITRFYSIKLG